MQVLVHKCAPPERPQRKYLGPDRPGAADDVVVFPRRLYGEQAVCSGSGVVGVLTRSSPVVDVEGRVPAVDRNVGATGGVGGG